MFTIAIIDPILCIAIWIRSICCIYQNILIYFLLIQNVILFVVSFIFYTNIPLVCILLMTIKQNGLNLSHFISFIFYSCIHIMKVPFEWIKALFLLKQCWWGQQKQSFCSWFYPKKAFHCELSFIFSHVQTNIRVLLYIVLFIYDFWILCEVLLF